MIRVALDVHNLWGHVLGAVADGVDNHAAAHRAVGTRRARLIGPGDLQGPKLRIGRLQIEAKHGGRSSTDGRYLEEITAGRGSAVAPTLGRVIGGSAGAQLTYAP